MPLNHQQAQQLQMWGQKGTSLVSPEQILPFFNFNFTEQGQNTIFGEGASAFLLGKISTIFTDFGKLAPFQTFNARKNKRINLLNYGCHNIQ